MKLSSRCHASRCWSAKTVGILLVLIAMVGQAHAQATPFYKDKTIRIIVGFTSGGLYDQYARVLARYMGKHIPGNPNIIVQNMPGAGSLSATNYVYGVAKPDGLTLGMPGSGIYLDQLLGRKEATFDVAKFSWIGSVDQRDLLLYMQEWIRSPSRSNRKQKGSASAGRADLARAHGQKEYAGTQPQCRQSDARLGNSGATHDRDAGDSRRSHQNSTGCLLESIQRARGSGGSEKNQARPVHAIWRRSGNTNSRSDESAERSHRARQEIIGIEPFVGVKVCE
jgi:hypothetical protein